jgi:HD superfamily phosphohydrolase YqeK
MTEFDEIIFLADFIEETRKYPACIKLREFVFGNMKEGHTEANIRILHRAVISAIDSTVSNLKENGRFVNSKNILTKEALLSKINNNC